MELTKGANAPIQHNKVKAVLSWAGSIDVDVAALLCASTGKVRSDDDFIFYNQPRHQSSAVMYEGKQRGGISADTLSIDLSAVEDAIEKIVISSSVSEGTFSGLSQLSLVIVNADTHDQLIKYVISGATVETALIAGELYRRNGAWKFRAVGQGYSSGLGGVATDFGISVDDEPEVQASPAFPPPAAPAYAPPPAQPPFNSPAQFQQPAPNQYTQHQQPAAQSYGPPPQQPIPVVDEDAPEEEVTLQPFPTDNPYLQRVFKMKEFGRAPGRAIAVYRERVIDPEEKMIAAFKSKHGQYKWGYLVLTSHALRWFQTLPTRDEDLWSWDDVGLNGSVVVCEGWQYQLKGFGAGKKFKALMMVLAQSEGWEKAHS